MKLPRQLDEFLSGRGDIVKIVKSGPGTQALLAARLLARGQDVAVVVPGERELGEMRALLGLLTPQSAFRSGTGPFGRDPWIVLPPYPPRKPDRLDWPARWAALHALSLRRRPVGLILTADNLLPKWPSPAVAAAASVTLARGEEMSPELLLEQLAGWGYARSAMVASPGETAMRGDILDVFPPGYAMPVRVEFFGDAIEAIRLFDPATQRSREDLKELTLLPAAPALLAEPYLGEAAGAWARLKTTGQINARTKAMLEEAAAAGDGNLWPGLFYQQPVDLGAYLPEETVMVLSRAAKLRSVLEESVWSWQEFLDAAEAEQGWAVPEQTVLWPEEQARKIWLSRRQIVCEDLMLGLRKEGAELPEKELTAFTDLFWKPEERQRPWSALTTALQKWEGAGQTVLTFHSARARAKFLEFAAKEGLFPKLEYAPEHHGVFALTSTLTRGAELSWANVRILPETLLQPEKPRLPGESAKGFKGLSAHSELKPGDLLVHRDFGVCRFEGLTRLKLGDVANDYLLLKFDGDDKLYLPVDRIRVVQQFKGPEGATPALDSLRGGRWKATKLRARKAVEQIAADLVEMYAYRRIAKGYAYREPGELFREFEAGFGFEETPDQASAIRDVLEDMERDTPMDRLICGDVGYGKTEVAMRAAFRAVLDGKQVALLCPTTVLAEQHYLNFKSRMQNFPVHVSMLSRFVPKPDQKTVLAAAAKGRVDILIGTHRMLSEDVALPNLGLLILDEEQRFGVKHKEKLKALRKNVDALTLTATPIPRTLQLSLSGIRSLSVIETPPPERKAVETALIERDEPLLSRIVHRELERQGQIFWVHNRVQSLDEVERYVKKLAPQARVASAHGQMTATKLEDVFHKFWHGELDILVCTAIVESGLDFPNVNTLVVDGAQMFGLGQLYQLRGRVGRGDRQAYAYFVVNSLDGLAETARKRLQVILDLDYLGAGFQVAMEDLRLRGAGNILGEAQSGQIARVGLDLFLEMLEEEVQRLKGEPVRTTVEPELNIVFAAHIPEGYVPEPVERLKYYRQLSSAPTDEAARDLALELRDRFGPLPEPLENFLAVLCLKRVFASLGALKADLYPNRVVVAWPDKDALVATQDVLAWLQTRTEWAKLLPPGRLELRAGGDAATSATLTHFAAELAALVPPLRQTDAAGS